MCNDEIMPIKVKINNDINNMKIYTLCDLHIGSQECNLTQIRNVVDFIKNTPDCYCILLGDILDTALKNSKTDIYSQTMMLADAQKLACELLMPIKDKILALLPGNHENRVWRETGVDISLWLAERLGVQDKYRLGGVALSIDFGKDVNGKPYKLNIFGQHGSRGGRKLGGALNALEEMDNIVSNADIYIMAHTHQSIRGGRSVFAFTSHGNIEKSYKYYFNAPSFLNYGGYGYDKGYKPGDDRPCYLNIRPFSVREGSKLINNFKIDEVML